MRFPLIAVAVLVGTSCNAAPPEVKTDEQKTLYSLGFAVADNIKQFNLTPAEVEIVKAGFADGAAQKKPVVEPKDFYPKIRELQTARLAASATKEKEAGQAFLAKAAAEKGAVVSKLHL